MADPLSTLAGLVSLADVTIRACRRVHQFVLSWKDAPQAVKTLQQTIESIRSTLGNLKLFVEEYNSSTPRLRHGQTLPDSMIAEMRSIKDNVDALNDLLLAMLKRKNFTRKAVWALQEQKLTALAQRLENQQITLTLGLQAIAQRSSIARHRDMFAIEANLQQGQASSTERMLAALEPISQRLDLIEQVETSASTGQASLNTSFEVLREASASSQSHIDNRFDSLSRELSEMRILGGSSTSEIVVRPSANDTLIRILREELKQLVMPIQDQLNLHSMASDSHHRKLRGQIDSIANGIHQRFQDHPQHVDAMATQDFSAGEPEYESRVSSPERSPHYRIATSRASCNAKVDEEAAAFIPSITSRRVWNRTWSVAWRLGFLQIRVSAYEICNTVRRRMSYEVLIDFKPSQRFLTLRGVSISCRSQQDQRGSLQLCPTLSSFAVVSQDSDAFKAIEEGDLVRLRNLFRNGKASPTDRNEEGITLLHAAVIDGQYDICKVLLTEGADPLIKATSYDIAVNPLGDCLVVLLFVDAIPYGGSGDKYLKTSGMEDHIAIARMFQAAGCEVTESIFDMIPLRFLEWLAHEVYDDGFSGDHHEGARDPCYKDYDELLALLRNQVSESSVRIDDYLGMLLFVKMRDSHFCSEEFIYDAKGAEYRVDLLCRLGANTRYKLVPGVQHLHILFHVPWSDENSPHIKQLAYTLIVAGADIYACDDYGRTPTSLAYRHDRLPEWIEVLKRCGYDWESVYHEERNRPLIRQKCYNAERSGVDTKDLVSSTRQTLPRRRGAYHFEADA